MRTAELSFRMFLRFVAIVFLACVASSVSFSLILYAEMSIVSGGIEIGADLIAALFLMSVLVGVSALPLVSLTSVILLVLKYWRDLDGRLISIAVGLLVAFTAYFLFWDENEDMGAVAIALAPSVVVGAEVFWRLLDHSSKGGVRLLRDR